jgi:hypothetical protein
MQGPARYGNFYWCVKTKLSKSGEIYVNADRVEFTASGGVIFWCDPTTRLPAAADDESFCQTANPNLALAAGQWLAIFAASCLDGSAIAVDHWEGEVVR